MDKAKKKVKLNVVKRLPKKAPAKKKKVKLNVIKRLPKKVEVKKEKIDFKVVMKGVDKKLNNIYPDVIENAGSLRRADSLIKKLVKNILKENKFNNNDEAIRFINKISNDRLFSMVP